jgi:transposase-like protein
MAAEIMSTVERRRRWPAEEKLRIMSEALELGAVVAAVADRNGVCRSQLYTWLRLARDDRLPGISIAQPPCYTVHSGSHRAAGNARAGRRSAFIAPATTGRPSCRPLSSAHERGRGRAGQWPLHEGRRGH